MAAAEGSKTPRGTAVVSGLIFCDLRTCKIRLVPASVFSFRLHFLGNCIRLCMKCAGAGHLTPRDESELSKTFFALFPVEQNALPIALDAPAANDE